MRFLIVYRASFYLMLTFATLVLSVDATDDNPLAMLYPPAVALVGFVAFCTVDRNPRLGPSRNAANLIALASGALSIAEYQYDPNLLLLAAAHWLVYLQIIKMLLPKTIEDDWFLFLLGVVQVLVGGVISQSDMVGMMLMGWALTSLWVLTLFALRRDALRMNRVPFGSSGPGPLDRSDPYRGLFDLAFVGATIRVAAITLALGGLIFLAMPRRTPGQSRGGESVGKHLSGFDDEVQLGQLGEILENDSVVMSIEQVDGDDRRINPDYEPTEQRWRGLSLEHYEFGRWRRPTPRTSSLTLALPEYSGPIIRQIIKLEPTDSPVLFGLRPVVDVFAHERGFQPVISEVDGLLLRSDARPVAVEYRLDSSRDPDKAQVGESYPNASYIQNLLQVPADVRKKLGPIAEAIVRDIDPSDPRARASALANYLHGPKSEFRYTLATDAVDPSIDPVVDFVVNRKEGHCEFFASALALMARTVDIPTRVINGFKGGDYNAISGLTTVRQKHAHSWVEALVEPERVDRPGKAFWMTLDPTPADQRNASVAQVGGVLGNFRQVTDFVRYVWVFYIVGFNAERQDRFLYEPIRSLVREARRGFGMIWAALKVWLHFPSVGSFFSLRGFAVSFVALLLLAGLARLAVGLGRRLWRRVRGRRAGVGASNVGDVFYRRLVALLDGLGLARPATETPREFARRAAIILAGRGQGSEGVADVPPLVVDAFYRTRFGDHPLDEADERHLGARLDALEAHLKPAPA